MRSLNMKSILSSESSLIKIGGQDYVQVEHEWSSDSYSGAFQSIVEPKTFKPVVHIRYSDKGLLI
jgi:hypothetical protein